MPDRPLGDPGELAYIAGTFDPEPAQPGMRQGSQMSDPLSPSRDKRAGHYRAQASKLRLMAVGESPGTLRDYLIRAAGEYDKLAESIDAVPKHRAF